MSDGQEQLAAMSRAVWIAFGVVVGIPLLCGVLYWGMAVASAALAKL